MHYRQMFDFDLSFLEEMVAVLDRRLQRLDREIKDHPDPDGWGLLDRSDYATGVGFIVCQNYLTAVIGEDFDKKRSLALGPVHARGVTIASAIWAGANYAKHRPEGEPHHETVDTLRAFGVLAADPPESGRNYDYPLANLLYELLTPQPIRFATVLPLLEQWRDAVFAAAPPA